MPYDAFISYSTYDKAAADAACAALEASGIRCWIAPRDIMPGAEWGEAIIDAINQCHVMVLIFSEHANGSPQIRREIERAITKGVPVLPLRIQDVAPARSLEYFIGTVHWLDALTPPLESHLRALVESVKALLKIDPVPPRIVLPPSTAQPVAPPNPSKRIIPIVAACLASAVAAIGIWWLLAGKSPPGLAVSTPLSAPAQRVFTAHVDPGVVGTLEYDTVMNNLDTRFVSTISADGTFQMVISQDQSGTYQAGNGVYTSVDSRTSQVQTSTYRAVSNTSIAVTNAGGTAVFRRIQPATPFDPSDPPIPGTWQAVIPGGGYNWTLTVQDNPDGTFTAHSQTLDHGICTYAFGQWSSTSAVTGQTSAGTYTLVGRYDIAFTGPTGPSVWHRSIPATD